MARSSRASSSTRPGPAAERNVLAAAIEPEDPSVASAIDIANDLARKKKVEIAHGVTRDLDAATFSEQGVKLGDDLCRAIGDASGRRSV